MIEEINIEAALDYIRDNAPKLGEAKANRIYLEQFRKSKKALLMNSYIHSSENRVTDKIRESYAYAHPEYLELLKGLQAAVEIEETVKWRMIGAQAKVEIFRTQQANKRMTDKAHL